MKKSRPRSSSQSPITISELRANIYKIFDQVIESGQPLEIYRAGTKLTIVPDQSHSKHHGSKLDRIKRVNCLNCKPEELLNMSWEAEWLKKVDKDWNT